MQKLKQKLKSFLNLDDTPHEIALSFSIGVFIAFTPFYGLHTILGILAFVLFRLNKVSVMTGSLLNLPWISPGVYFPCYYVGTKIWKLVPVLDKYQLFTWFQFKSFFSSWFSFQSLFEPANFMMLFLPTLIGTTLIGSIVSLSTYFLLNRWLTNRRMRQQGGNEYDQKKELVEINS